MFHLVSLWLVLGEAKLYQNLGDFSRIGDFTWRVSDCEELVGGFTGDDGLSSNVVKMIYGSKVDISNLQNST